MNNTLTLYKFTTSGYKLYPYHTNGREQVRRRAKILRKKYQEIKLDKLEVFRKKSQYLENFKKSTSTFLTISILKFLRRLINNRDKI